MGKRTGARRVRALTTGIAALAALASAAALPFAPAKGAEPIPGVVLPDLFERVTYLSDLPAATSPPPVNQVGPFERDRANGGSAANDGPPIRLRGRQYAKGLGMHATARVAWNLDKAQTYRFAATVGVDDAVNSDGSVIFKVFKAVGAFPDQTYTLLHETPILRGNGPTNMIEVTLSGADQIQLIVANAGDGIASDWADWADARLITGGNLPPPPITLPGPEPEPEPEPVTTYLSDLTPTSVRNEIGPMERDQSNGQGKANDGGPLIIQGTRYDKGLGTHANFDASWNLGGNYQQFLTDVGIDDAVGAQGTVRFRIYVDGVQAADSGTMTGSMSARSFALNVTGKQTLRLVAEMVENINYDWADWGGARLISQG